MKKAIIINNKTGLMFSASMEESALLAWIANNEETGSWGKKAQEGVLIKSLDAYDNSVKLNVRKNDSNEDICDLPQEYEITISDITAEITRKQVKEVVSKAMAFGQSLMEDFATDNILAGITQAGKTRAVSDFMLTMQSLLLSGSLYAAKDEIDAMIANGLPAELAPFITEAKLLEYKQKIIAYLA